MRRAAKVDGNHVVRLRGARTNWGERVSQSLARALKRHHTPGSCAHLLSFIRRLLD